MDVADGQMGIHAGEKCLVLGFDPGRDKIGFAFADFEGELILSGIFASSEREKFFEDISGFIIEQRINIIPENIFSHLKFIAIGNGTKSKEFYDYVSEKFNCEIIITDEKNTTLEARSLYWKIHEPDLWVKLLPEGMRVPGRILDDLAAWSIVLRALKKYRDIGNNKL